MTDKERLEEMEEYYPEDAAEYDNDIPWVIKYAKEQAGYVQELKSNIKRHKKEKYRNMKEKERYRGALEKVIHASRSDVNRAIKIAKWALEGDSK